MWNNFLAEIVKYLTLFDVKWNSPFTFAKQIFHSEAISHGEAIFHSPKANFVEKSTHLSTKTMCAFFNEIRLRRVKYGFAMWNSFAVKYLLRKCDGRISFHIATKEQYFTIYEVYYFTFGASRIFHLKSYLKYDTIIVERRCYNDWFKAPWPIHRLCG